MPEEETTRSNLPAIRAVIDVIIKAIRTNDVELFLAHCAPEVVVYDLIPPLEQKGFEAVRQAWILSMSAFEGPIDYEIDRLDVQTGGDIAFSRCLAQFGATTKEGHRIASHVRSTLGFRRVNGHWKIVHEHLSVPLDTNGQGLFQLQS
jgi:ketosteroid isomerase-like protein